MSLNIKSGGCYHIYNQGNNRRRIFFNDQHYLFFLGKMRRQLLEHSRILAYCLMPNHFHWLVYAKEEPDSFDAHPLVNRIATLLSSYTQGVNRQTGRSGSLFRQKTKAVELDTQNYARTCFYYIHQNPVRAGLAYDFSKWPYSSYFDYTRSRNGTLVDKDFACNYLGISSDLFIRQSKLTLNSEIVGKIF